MFARDVAPETIFKSIAKGLFLTIKLAFTNLKQLMNYVKVVLEAMRFYPVLLAGASSSTAI